MSEIIDGHKIRQTILEIVQRDSNNGSLQTTSVLHETLDKMGLQRSSEIEQALLTVWHDLFRTGYLAWGLNLSNPNPPFCHVTEQGRRTLRNLSRDPANPEGYLAHVSKIGEINEIAKSYLEEALKTYNVDCYKSTAVMIGAASESLILEIRDNITQRLRQMEKPIHADLEDWRLKKVLERLENELLSRKGNMNQHLVEQIQQNWPAFIGQIRRARNEAGHPASIEPVTHETVYASLLIFPELLSLTQKLKDWITGTFV